MHDEEGVQFTLVRGAVDGSEDFAVRIGRDDVGVAEQGDALSIWGGDGGVVFERVAGDGGEVVGLVEEFEERGDGGEIFVGEGDAAGLAE